MICLIQLFYYEAQLSIKGKKKKILECKDCPFKDKCKERSNHEKTD